MNREVKCRFCGENLSHTFVDLGASPLSNSFIRPENYNSMEPYYPLHAYVCGKCFLVQLEEYQSPQNIFGDYIYFSSFSASWLKHCAKYADKVVDEFNLKDKFIVEIASNDGYLLQFFKAKGIKVLGIEPAENVAQTAIKKGIPTETAFFGTEKAKEMRSRGLGADWIAANNVLAHVPDINDFVEGFKILLNKDGVATFEFPHLMQLMRNTQFDTIYHEHFSYISLYTAQKIFKAHGLEIFHVEELETHGGSLRLYIQHENGIHAVRESVARVLNAEKIFGLQDIKNYIKFSDDVKTLKMRLLSLLIQCVTGGGGQISASSYCRLWGGGKGKYAAKLLRN